MRSVQVKPSHSSRDTASIVTTRSVQAEAHCSFPAALSGKFILLYRISRPINKKRCQKRLPRLRCHHHHRHNNNNMLVTLAEHTSDHGKQTNSSTQKKGGQGIHTCKLSLLSTRKKGPLGGLSQLFQVRHIINKNKFRARRINNNNNRRLVTLAEHTSDHGRQTNSSTEEKGEQV